jgi:hypothetical protein
MTPEGRKSGAIGDVHCYAAALYTFPRQRPTVEVLRDVFRWVRPGAIRITRNPGQLRGSKAFRTFIKIHSLFKSERLRVTIKQGTDQISNDLCLPRLGIKRQTATPQNCSAYKTRFCAPLEIFNVNTGSRFAQGFQPFLCI